MRHAPSSKVRRPGMRAAHDTVVVRRLGETLARAEGRGRSTDSRRRSSQTDFYRADRRLPGTSSSSGCSSRCTTHHACCGSPRCRKRASQEPARGARRYGAPSRMAIRISPSDDALDHVKAAAEAALSMIPLERSSVLLWNIREKANPRTISGRGRMGLLGSSRHNRERHKMNFSRKIMRLLLLISRLPAWPRNTRRVRSPRRSLLRRRPAHHRAPIGNAMRRDAEAVPPW